VIVDGNMSLDLVLPYRSIIKGDTKSKSIAAASILAKVTRDRIMLKYDKLYPEYGFARHKGYPTREHRDILKKIGPSRIHRKSFAGV
ncbi:MAG: ribonuclease HII, partial [Candidatus Omnitrophota bacterium]